MDLRSEEWGRLGVGPRVVEAALAAERETAGRCAEIERTAAAWELRVLDAFHAERVSDYYLHGSTGYGYNDVGREALDRIYARVFGADAGLVRPQFISGTHALGVAVHGVLSPGDTVVIGNGMPYDTMQQVMGIGAGAGRRGSLADRGVNVRVMPLTAQDEVDVEAVKAALTTEPKMFYLQKSRGYAWREALSYEDIRCLFALAKEISPKTICFVDNCYGELVDEHEMGNAGADLFAGSLIKNPGGGLARTGGYICGRADLVERAAERLSVPGLSMDMGATGGYQELFYQGLFLAPHVVGQALQGAVVSSRLFELLGFETMPIAADPRHDIVQAVRFQNAEQLLAFCRGIQAAAPVDAHAVPEPEALPGYADPVVMAAGTFVLGASIELSADAPLRPPYTAYMQGGLTRSHAVFGAMMAAENVLRLGK